jgi:hypothetical protein
LVKENISIENNYSNPFSITHVWMNYKTRIKSSFCLPDGKADDTPSPALPTVRSSLLQLHPWTPWIWGILDFRSFKVKFDSLQNFLNLRLNLKSICWIIFPVAALPVVL